MSHLFLIIQSLCISNRAFAKLEHKVGDFPVTEKVARQCLSLPMSPYLSDNDQSLIIDTILDLDGN